MKPASPEQVLFAEALQCATPEARAAYLAGACGTDTALRRRVEALLRAAESAGDFLEEPPTGLAAGDGSTTVVTALSEKPGDRIGRYKLLQQIGEGGCGVVYMAEQEEPVRRRVALKVIKLGMDTKSVIARFEAERQALALMDHPNIAKVFDAGATDTGRLYFVMELVRGIKITDFCDQNNLSTEERLKLFILVCQAIQHAHQKGVIHRDIKPSNILVTVNDGVPVPKVIDFGIVKATGQRLTDKTLFTQFHSFIGTPAYISPEQAEMSSVDIDTRSDIYSLGVLLYELLTGRTPFDGEALLRSGLDAMRRTIRHEQPSRPSLRLDTLGMAEATELSAKRQASVPELAGDVRGDLDWVVMKCLEKDRSRRYETANGLAVDIQRHLSNEPVIARPPSNLYRFQKMIRRNKLAFAAASAITAALVLGLGVSTWMFFKEKQARQRANTEAAKSQQVAQFMKDMLNGVGPWAALGRDTAMLRDILATTAERVGKDLKDQPEVEAELRGTIGAVYWQLGEYGKSETMHRQALALWRLLHGNEDLRVADSLHKLAMALLWQDKFDEAGNAVRESLRIREELLGKGEHQDIATSLDGLALILMRQGKNLDEAEACGRKGLAMRRNLFGAEHPDVATSLDNLALVLWGQRKLDEAELTQRQALAMKKKLWGNEHLNVGFSLNNLMLILTDRDKLGEAEVVSREALAIRRKLLGNQHPEVANTLENLSRILQKEGKLTEAETVYRGWLENLRSRLPPDDLQLAVAVSKLTSTLLAAKRFAEAEPPARECLTIREKKLPDEWLTFNARSMLGESLLGQKKYADAEPLLLSSYEGLKQREDKIPAGSKRYVKETLQRLVQLYEVTGQSEKAAEWKKKLAEFDKTETGKKAAVSRP